MRFIIKLNKISSLNMSNIEAIIDKCIEDIWQTYDKDGNGSLDKDETRNFVKNILSETDKDMHFSDADFEVCF